jgi:hypothetical protein
MLVESFAVGGSAAHLFESTRLVVRDKHGNPICVIIEYLDGPDGRQVHYVLRPNDPDFEPTLEALGVKAVRVLKTLRI